VFGDECQIEYIAGDSDGWRDITGVMSNDCKDDFGCCSDYSLSGEFCHTPYYEPWRSTKHHLGSRVGHNPDYESGSSAEHNEHNEHNEHQVIEDYVIDHTYKCYKDVECADFGKHNRLYNNSFVYNDSAIYRDYRERKDNEYEYEYEYGERLTGEQNYKCGRRDIHE